MHSSQDKHIQPRRNTYKMRHLILRLLLGPNTSTQITVALFNNLLHYTTCKTIDCRVVTTHRLVLATRRPPYNFSKIYTRPVTMDQPQGRSSSSMNLMIHHATQFRRLRKEAAERLKLRRHSFQRIKLSMDTTQHPLAILQSSRHPLNSKTEQSKRPSTSPIRPKRIARPHFRIVQTRHLQLHGRLFIPGPPRQHFARQQPRSRQKHRNNSKNQAAKQKQNSPRRKSDNFTTHEARFSVMASARSRRVR